MGINRAIRTERQMKALTGLSKKEFGELSQTFGKILKIKEKPIQKRQKGGGRKHSLKTADEKLFYIMMYLKCYPTFDVMGFYYQVDRAQTNRWVHELLPIIEETLGKEIVLPERKIRSVEEFEQLYPEINQVFIDGTERPTQRSSNNEKQKLEYSGKKKRHSKKNLIVSDDDKRILILTDTEVGSKHDYTLFKQSNMGDILPAKVESILDSGFQGIKTDFPNLGVSMPTKKPKGGELSPLQKLVNKRISKTRVVVEHAIGGAKRFNVVTDVYRSRKPKLDDTFMLLSCGLWNFHLKLSA